MSETITVLRQSSFRRAAGEEIDSRLTESFRALANSELGKLDAAVSFMYFYNRFGRPLYDHNDEYKILYEYHFAFKDLFVTVHASYRECVYFNLFVPRTELDEFLNKEIEFHLNIAKRVIGLGIPYQPGLFFDNKFPKGNRTLAVKNQKLVNNEWKKFFLTENQVADFNEMRSKGISTWDKYEEPFLIGLVDKFKSALTDEEKKRFYDYDTCLNLSTYPKIESQAHEFFNDLKTGSWVRDAAFNICGYESENNKIIYKEEGNAENNG